MAAKVGEIDVLGQTLDVYAEANTGLFKLRAQDDDGRSSARQLGSGETLEKAKTAARKAIHGERIEVEVPFRFSDGTSAIARRMDGRSGGILVTIDGQRDSIDWRNRKVFGPDAPDEELARYRAAENDEREAQRVKREIETHYGIDLAQQVRNAVQKAAEEKAAEA